ncbi:probable ATP-dependent RNA helicase DDX4 isoform X1 [Ambystoma mexicanum]|uniref:probable ATP-dependent RNA helicase DDX4 isoform X1 n=1 Tax=Ambystoma mexicanum TaxID=8296 RepID=UPI0037E8F2BA
MADEDWDSELTTGTSSFVPSFSKLETEKAFNFNQNSGLKGSSEFGERNTWVPRNRNSKNEVGHDEWNKNDAPGQRGFGAGRGVGFQRVLELFVMWFTLTGGFKNRNETAGSDSGKGENGPERNGSFSRRGGFRGASVAGDSGDQSAGRGFGHSEDSFGERRGRFTGGRGTRGGFGRKDENDEQRSSDDFGSKGGFDNQTSFEGRGRGGGFGGRGGYKGRNEDVGSEAGQGPWKSDEGRENDDKPAARVTYVPPPPPDTEDGIFAHYQTGINFDKYDDILTNVTGPKPPPAILTFEEANLPETLYNNISKAGYTKLTPVQKYSIPIVLARRDLMACAQTGSGKTAAFLLPILAHLMQDGIPPPTSELQEPEVIIVAPTRELINQIFLDARKFAYRTCIKPVVVYGGTQTIHSLRQIYQGCNILCATPGRLIDIIRREKIGLTKLRYLVLDEADRMLDMGFGPDMKTLVTSPGMPTKEERQTLMFSATFPENIQSLAREFLKPDYLFVTVGQVGGACADVQQKILEVDQYEKKDKLVEILQGLGKERTMVFVGTKKMADYLTTLLCQENISATSIHGDRLQREREEALADFRFGKCHVLVATNVAARGLDIENVQHVINYDLSDNIEEYVHRIGRTGRCGNVGKAISFFHSNQNRDLAPSLLKVLSDAQQEVPTWLEEMAYSIHGSSSRASTFASVDSRRDTSFNTGGYAQSSAFAADEDASWD